MWENNGVSFYTGFPGNLSEEMIYPLTDEGWEKNNHTLREVFPSVCVCVHAKSLPSCSTLCDPFLRILLDNDYNWVKKPNVSIAPCTFSICSVQYYSAAWERLWGGSPLHPHGSKSCFMILESIQQDGAMHRNQSHAGFAFLPPAGRCHNREYISFCLALMVAWQLQYLPCVTYLCNLFQKQKIFSEKKKWLGKRIFFPLFPSPHFYSFFQSFLNSGRTWFSRSCPVGFIWCSLI